MIIQAFSDVEKPFLFSDLAANKNKKGFSTSEKARITSMNEGVELVNLDPPKLD